MTPKGPEHEQLRQASGPSPLIMASFPFTTNRSKRFAKDNRTAIASGTSSILSTFTAYPLDSVKSRMQAYKFDSFSDCVRHTYRTEGFRSFWRGSVAPIFSITVVRTISFSIYQKAKYAYSASIQRVTGVSPLVHVNTLGTMPNLSTLTCFGAAGGTAGAAITLVACPFELTKLSSQISVLMAKSDAAGGDDLIRRSYQQLGTFKTARNIVKHRGIGGLYSGFQLHLMRDTIGTAIYFMTYESLKQTIATKRDLNSPTSPLAVFLAGGLCGLVSWACIYPIDSAKSIYQRNCLTVGKDGNPKMPRIQFFNRRMYRGLAVSMGRSCVVNAIFFSSFEKIKRYINALEEA